ncbi:MAG: type II toxin-antitoxin system VapC family toxin [Pseudomonadota bacterium]
MSANYLLDASAVLAFLQGEPGAEIVGHTLQSGAPCWVSAANQAEIIAKALDRGLEPESLRDILRDLDYRVVDNTADDGAEAGWMREATRSLGLSLGDRLCLATARRLGTSVLTADRAWLGLGKTLQINIQLTRPGNH